MLEYLGSIERTLPNRSISPKLEPPACMERSINQKTLDLHGIKSSQAVLCITLTIKGSHKLCNHVHFKSCHIC